MKIKVLALALMFFGALFASSLYVTDTEASSKTVCIYCKNPNYGDCGSAPLSSPDNPKRMHKHQSNGKNCVWCGMQNNPQSCRLSPNGQHQL
jgi:hypothetical protein